MHIKHNKFSYIKTLLINCTNKQDFKSLSGCLRVYFSSGNIRHQLTPHTQGACFSTVEVTRQYSSRYNTHIKIDIIQTLFGNSWGSLGTDEIYKGLSTRWLTIYTRMVADERKPLATTRQRSRWQTGELSRGIAHLKKKNVILVTCIFQKENSLCTMPSADHRDSFVSVYLSPSLSACQGHSYVVRYFVSLTISKLQQLRKSS